MLSFSQRAFLENEYERWLTENSSPEITLKDCALNVINFLYGEGIIEEEKVLEYIKNKDG